MQRAWKIVGHRGFAQDYPENSLVAFQAALELGVDAIELDVQLSRDGVPVVLHDSRLERTCNVRGALADYVFAELNPVSCHYPARFGERFAPQPLLSLEQFSDLLVPDTVTVFIEIKKESIAIFTAETCLQKVLQASARLGDQRCIISFDEKIVALTQQRTSLAAGWCLERYDAQSLQRAQKLQPSMLICACDLPTGDRLWPGPWEWFVYGIENAQQAQAWHARGANWIEADNPSIINQRIE